MTNEQKYANIFIFILGYGLGIVFSNVFYRDALGSACKKAVMEGELISEDSDNNEVI